MVQYKTYDYMSILTLLLTFRENNVDMLLSIKKIG